MTVEELIEKSLQELREISCEDKKTISKKQNSKLIFPKYFNNSSIDDNRRICEQEARFLFVRQLENSHDEHSFYYSVETPTEYSYIFSKDGATLDQPKIDTERKSGKSGKIDICLFDSELVRTNLLEFKALNPCPQSYKKDFIKLLYEPKKEYKGYPNFFIQILKTYASDTITSLKKKYESAFNIKNNNTDANNVIVYLCIIEIPTKYKNISPIINFNKDDYKSKLDKLIIKE